MYAWGHTVLRRIMFLSQRWGFSQRPQGVSLDLVSHISFLSFSHSALW